MMENRSLPTILVVYMDQDEFLAEKFMDELSFLEESNMVDLQRWFLSERYLDAQNVERFRTRIARANLIIVLGSRNLSRASELNSLLVRTVSQLQKRNLVIPIVLVSVGPDDLGWMSEYFGENLPRSASAVFGERESTDTDDIYSEIVEKIVEKLIESSSPRPYRGISNKTVFISYARKNYKRANVIRLAIQQLGYKTWMDKHNMVGGQNWVNRIDKGIRDSWCLLLIWSSHAQKSEYVNYEWAFAMGNSTCVIPIIIEKTGVHPRLTMINYLGWHNLRTKHYPWYQLENALNNAEQNYRNGVCNS